MFWLEGVIAAVVVLVGVVTAHWLEKRAQEQRRIEEDVLELGSVITGVAAGYVASDLDTSMGSDWWVKRDRVWELANRLQATVGRLGLRRKNVAEEALEAFVLKLAAADSMLIGDGERPPAFVALELSTNELRGAILDAEPKAGTERWERVQALKELWRRMERGE